MLDKINKKPKYTVKLFEAFAGIGATYKALKNIANEMNWNIESVGIIEWFIPAIIGYQLIHFGEPQDITHTHTHLLNLSSDSKTPLNKNRLEAIKNSNIYKYIVASEQYSHNTFDITKTTYQNIPKNIDIFTYSFPCQDLSIQGKQKGMSKNLKTRSGLLWEIERILYELKSNFHPNEMPKYLLMENVNSILFKKNLADYNKWLDSLKKLGYVSKTYTLNSANFGSPQNRKRTFCLSIRKDYKKSVNFRFSKLDKTFPKNNISSILEDNYDFLDWIKNYELSPVTITKSDIKRLTIKNYTNFNSENYIYFIDKLGPTLTASGANSRIKILIGDEVRYMTSLECFRYMGFDDSDYQAIKDSNLISNSKMMFLCGNSISVQVLENIFKSLRFDHGY